MILVDTSAWVEFLSDTGSPTCIRVDELVAEEIAICHPVRMEVLARARDERHLQDLRGLLTRATILPTLPTDYESAAVLYRTCKRRGETVRKLIDCLIAAQAISDTPRGTPCRYRFQRAHPSHRARDRRRLTTIGTPH
jgi:predicted nucleic acid-binding protein